jgi:hypothetical protein
MQSPFPAPSRAPQAHPSLPGPPGTPGTPAIASAPVADLAFMQSQLSELRVQQAGLRAQSSGLRRQLDNMLQSNPARPGVAQEWANVGVQLAQVDGAVAALQARISDKQGIPIDRVSSTGAPFPYRNKPDPDMVVGMSIGLLMLIGFPIALAYARRIWRGNPAAPAARVDEIAPRLDRLEQAVDSIAIEIERISEGQRFVTKIFAERPAQAQPAPADEKGPLALGAGPIEQVRVSGREAVRESNTTY